MYFHGLIRVGLCSPSQMEWLGIWIFFLLVFLGFYQQGPESLTLIPGERSLWPNIAELHWLGKDLSSEASSKS